MRNNVIIRYSNSKYFMNCTINGFIRYKAIYRIVYTRSHKYRNSFVRPFVLVLTLRVLL